MPDSDTPARRRECISAWQKGGAIDAAKDALTPIEIARPANGPVIERHYPRRRASTKVIKQVTAPHTPVPFADNLEDMYIPDAAQVQSAVKEVMEASK